MGNYQHDWPKYMTTKSLVLTVTAIFLEWRRIKDMVGSIPWNTDEIADAMQVLWDELYERTDDAYDEIFHAPGMDQEALEQFMEIVA